MPDLPDRLKDQPLQLRRDDPVEIIPALSLHRKLAQVLYEAERIPKRGRAPQAMGGYPFVQVGDAADYIRKALAEKVLTMMPTAVHVVGQQDRETKSGGNMTTVDLVVEWTITDGESGESITIQSFGAGADGGDKYSGKAMTSAMKYALLSGFLLSTGDDTEGSNLPETLAGRLPEPMDHQVGPPDANGATEHLLGVQSFQGTVKLGTADAYKLEVRELEGGPAFGFRLEMADDKAIPQVLVQGDPAIVAIAGSGGDPVSMKDHWVRVKGSLFAVRAQGRRSFNRLRVSEIQTREWAYPPLPASSDPSEAGTTAKAARADEAVLMPEDAPQTPASSLTKGGASADDPTLTIRRAITGSTPGSTGNPSGVSSGSSATLTDVGLGGPANPSDTAEAPLPEEAGVAGGTDEPPAVTLCGAVGSDFGTICGLAKGHANKHKELATDGRVLASW